MQKGSILNVPATVPAKALGFLKRRMCLMFTNRHYERFPNQTEVGEQCTNGRTLPSTMLSARNLPPDRVCKQQKKASGMPL